MLKHLKLGKACAVGSHKLLNLFRLLTLTFCHKRTYLLGQTVAVAAKGVGLGNCGTVLLIQLNNLVHKRKLAKLKLIFNVLFYKLRILAEKFNIQHYCILSRHGAG